MSMPRTQTIRKIQTALNMNGNKILYGTSEFYSERQKRPVTVYHIRQSQFEPKKGKMVAKDLYKSCSQIDALLFISHLWNKAQEVGGELSPEDIEECKSTFVGRKPQFNQDITEKPKYNGLSATSSFVDEFATAENSSDIF